MVVLGYVAGANGVIVQVLHQVGVVNFDPTVATITSGAGVAVVLLSKLIDSRSWTAIQVAATQPQSTPLLPIQSLGTLSTEAPPSPEPHAAVASVPPVQLPPPAPATS